MCERTRLNGKESKPCQNRSTTTILRLTSGADVWLVQYSNKQEYTYLYDPLAKRETPTLQPEVWCDNARSEIRSMRDTDHLRSLDVESLYTSFPQDETVVAMEQVLFQTEWSYKTPHSFVLECIDLTLKKNFFEFEGELYLQTHGTSMGSTFAPSIAGLYFHLLETEKILTAHNPFWKKPGYLETVHR